MSITSTSLAATTIFISLDLISLLPIIVALVSIKLALNLFLNSKSALKFLFFSGIRLVIQYLSVIPSHPFSAFTEYFFPLYHHNLVLLIGHQIHQEGPHEEYKSL